jgi:hypothetical protein
MDGNQQGKRGTALFTLWSLKAVGAWVQREKQALGAVSQQAAARKHADSGVFV